MTAIVIQGNAMALPLPDECVDLAVTSPPYFGLRSYTDDGRPVPGQVGGEPTPGEFIDALIAATTEMVRVLKPSGSIFVNLGDKYGRGTRTTVSGSNSKNGYAAPVHVRPTGCNKSLMLLPERYRIAAVDRLGLIARAVIVWDKPNGLPESVTDRVRRSHEDWVHLTKMPRYFSAVDGIREPYSERVIERQKYVGRTGLTPRKDNDDRRDSGRAAGIMGFGTGETNPLGKLPDSVWRIPTAPLRLPLELGVDHFAAFPPEWPKRIIQGWSPAGVCVECGEGRQPIVEKDRTWNGKRDAHLDMAHGHQAQVNRSNRGETKVTFIGYVCGCHSPTAPTTPSVVLDPFGGTGTTAMVAHALGRVGISVDLSRDYCRVAQWRTNNRAQMAKVRDEVFHKPVLQSEGQDSLFTFAAVAQGGKK